MNKYKIYYVGRWFPTFWFGAYATTLGRFIFFHKNLKPQNEKPSVTNQLTLEHELVHYSRQTKYGVIKWLLRYIFDRNFRFVEELVAYKVSYIKRSQLFYLNEKNKIKFKNRIIKILSGRAYLWATNYEIANIFVPHYFDTKIKDWIEELYYILPKFNIKEKNKKRLKKCLKILKKYPPKQEKR